MSKILCVGDWHGSTNWAIQCVELAEEKGCSKLYQVGDHGLGFDGYDKFNRKISKRATELGIDVYFHRGNHDSTVVADKYISKLDSEKFYEIYPHLFYVPDGTAWEWDGVKFFAAGGAVSVDKEWRVFDKSWWPAEITAPEMVERAAQVGPVDILLTHDGPLETVDKLGLSPLSGTLYRECYINRSIISDILTETNPIKHIFGHYHESKRWQHPYSRTECIVLDCEYHGGSTMVLDLAQIALDKTLA